MTVNFEYRVCYNSPAVTSELLSLRDALDLMKREMELREEGKKPYMTGMIIEANGEYGLNLKHFLSTEEVAQIDEDLLVKYVASKTANYVQAFMMNKVCEDIRNDARTIRKTGEMPVE